MGRLRQLLSAMVLSVFAVQAQAGLMSADYVPGSGDNWITRHSDTGLDWLDVSLTRGLSFDQVRGGNWYQQGFRHASRAEVENLFAYAVVSDVKSGVADPASVFSLIKLFGPTAVSGGTTATVGVVATDEYGKSVSLVSHPISNSPFAAIFAVQAAAVRYFAPQPSGAADFLGALIRNNQADASFGNFLVRSSPLAKTTTVHPVSTPASWVLMLFGLLLLALRRRA